MGEDVLFENLGAAARETERARRMRESELRKRETEMRRKEQDLERLRKAHSPATRNTEKVRKRLRVESMLETAAAMTAELHSTVHELETLLLHTLRVDDAIDFAAMKITSPFLPDPLPASLAKEPKVPTLDGYLGKVKPKSILEKATRSKRFQRETDKARKAYTAGIVAYHEAFLDRQSRLARHQARIEASRAAYEKLRARRDLDVEALRDAYARHDASAVRAYLAMVLERSRYPQGFPQEFMLVYDPAFKELRIDYRLPGIGVVPAVGGFHYIKTRDAIEPKARDRYAIKVLYQRILAATALRTIHEVFEADRAGAVASVAFQGHIETMDKANGRPIRPCLVSLRAQREPFLGILLGNVDILACLRGLGGNLTSKPELPLAVKPVAAPGPRNL